MGIIGAILGLVVFGLVLSFILGKFGEAQTSVLSGDAASSIKTIIANAQQTYAHVPSKFQGVTAQALINNGDVPESNVTGSQIISNFGTPVSVQSTSHLAPNDSLYLILNIPRANCTEFVNNVLNHASVIAVGGAQVKNDNPPIPFSATTLGSRCTAGGSGMVSIGLIATL